MLEIMDIYKHKPSFREDISILRFFEIMCTSGPAKSQPNLSWLQLSTLTVKVKIDNFN